MGSRTKYTDTIALRRVLPYIETIGSERFKLFLQLPFKLNILDKVEENNINYEVVFDFWRGKKMGNFFKFKNEDEIILEFFATHYEIIIKNKANQQFPLPDTINDFINDMYRLNVVLYWSNWIDERFEPKEYLSKEGVENYFKDLLKKMDKSHELM